MFFVQIGDNMFIEFIHKNLAHVFFILLLISRLGDVLSTLFITPELKLENNLIAKKLGKPFIFISLLICFLPYYNITYALLLLIPSLLVSINNIGKLWMIKSFGETNYDNFINEKIKENGIKLIIIQNIIISILISLIAFTIFIFYNTSDSWGYWIAYSFILYSLITLFWGITSSLKRYIKIKRTL
jgi:hypothetical protein